MPIFGDGGPPTYVAKETELYRMYGCNLNGLVVCFVKQGMVPLCYNHHQSVIQWHEETDRDTNMDCRSV